MRKIRFSNIYSNIKGQDFWTWALVPYFFLSFVLLTLMGDPFYEGGSYMAYAHSMMRDADFNIVNLMPEEISRIVTVNFHHPDGHSEVQTPYLVFIYSLFSLIFWVLPLNMSSHNIALLTGFLVNFLSITMTHFCLRKTAQLLNIPYSPWDICLFLVGTVTFYFTFSVVTVLEIYFMPIVSYSLYLYLKLKGQRGAADLLSFGIVIGLMLSSNFSYKFLALGLVSLSILTYRLNLKDKILFLGSAMVYPSAHLMNIWLKYGKILDVHQGANHLLEFSALHFVKKLYYGYFLTDFLRSPLTLISFIILVVVLVMMIKRSKLLSSLESSFLLLWVLFTTFSYLPFMGDLVEGHLSGRYFIRFAPLLIFSIAYLRQKTNLPLVILISSLGFFTTLCFLAIDVIDPLIYAQRTFLTGEEWRVAAATYQYKIIHNFDQYAMTMIWLLPVALLMGFLCKKIFRSEKKMLELNLAMAFVFVVMTSLNVINSPTKIERLKAEGFYDNKVIGDGPHIYLIDYALEKLANIESSNPEIDMSDRLERFYQDVESQVVRSTPEFDQAIAKRDKNWSYYLQIYDDHGGR